MNAIASMLSLAERAPSRRRRGVPRNSRGVELDRRTHILLRWMSAVGADRLHGGSPQAARARYRQGSLVDLPAARSVERRDDTLPVESALRVRAHKPRDLGDGAPVLVWLHGGGFVIGDLDTHSPLCGALAERGRCLVLAVEYRKAPEHPFPAGVEDAVAAVRHLRTPPGRALLERLGGDPDRVAIGGDSAGGNLSAVVCQTLLAADEPQPLAQVLVYPATQIGHPSPSQAEFAENFLLSKATLDWFMDHYLPPEIDVDDPRVSPMFGPIAAELAPAIVRTAGFDPLRDEGEAFARKLESAGVDVDYRCHERLIHGFVTMGGALPAAREAIYDLGDDVRRLFAQG